jgi:type VI secretion system protein ImpH
MSNNGFHNTGLQSIPDEDIRAEVAAAELIENGLPEDRVMIQLLGPSKRLYRKDVEDITHDLSDYDHKDYSIVRTHKEGIYDMLPEGLFHPPAMPKNATSYKDIIDEIKKHRQQEKDARIFFMPFEAAMQQVLIQMALYESRLDKRSQHNDLVNIFSGHWNIFSLLDARQADLFLYILPQIHHLRDDYPVVSAIFEGMFLIPVSVSMQKQDIQRPESPMYSTLQNSSLGVNFTTGNYAYESGENEILVEIGPMDNAALKSFSPGSKNLRIKEMLGDFLLPAHLDVHTKWILAPVEKTMRLADGVNDFNSTMGLSTYL